jgi:hypothetical protein
MDRAPPTESEAIVDFYLGPNQPCLDGDLKYLKERKGLDKTFYEPRLCDSEYKGSHRNKEYIDSGLRFEEYYVLRENGVLDDLEDKPRPSGDRYKSSGHEDEWYNLYVKKYSKWENKCAKAGYDIKKYDKFLKRMDTIHFSFLAIVIVQCILGFINFGWIIFICCSTDCFKDQDMDSNTKKALVAKIIITIVLSIIGLTSVISIFSAKNLIDPIEAQYYNDKKCMVDYNQHQMEKFYEIFTNLNTNLIILALCLGFQVLYESLLYPMIKCLDKCM